ncbi:MAG TPA: DUF1223 domain-containing protein [Sphingomicrobium sp.]|nr:DUF1223 domain-containing protein [Sphingomicrobium sp.]
MNRRINAILAIALLSPSLSWAACDVKSGPKTIALVELYTSEGCSSCPPADKELSQFPSREYSFGQVVPISLHVDYWDDLGWKEPLLNRSSRSVRAGSFTSTGTRPRSRRISLSRGWKFATGAATSVIG